MQVFEHYRQNAFKASPANAGSTWRLPLSPDYYSERVTYATTVEQIRDLVTLARQEPLSHIGFDFEYQFARPGITHKGKLIFDPSSIRPLLCSVALAIKENDFGGRVLPFVVDVRQKELVAELSTLFVEPALFVGHNLRAEFLCLFRLGLPEPAKVWDTWVCSRASSLGRWHRNYAKTASDPAEEARVREDSKELEELRHNLAAVCSRHGVHHGFVGRKGNLQKSFLTHMDGADFSTEQIEYAAADAIAVALLHPNQIITAQSLGLLDHLVTVEMPWVSVNARIYWHGVRIDDSKCRRLLPVSKDHLESLMTQLRTYGIENVLSHVQLKRFFESVGLLHLFQQHGKYSFDKDMLETFNDRHAAIPLIRAAKKARQIQSDPMFRGVFAGYDGRVHPDHKQLGTDTGRQSCSHPNILGLGKLFRPMVVPEDGFGIGEVDLCQIEIGIAAAVYHDEDLVRMFNSGDVYAAMAQDFYANELSEDDRHLPGIDFKKKHGSKRDSMKRCTLGIIYGLSGHGLGNYLNVSRREAQDLLDRFLDMFPTLRTNLKTTVVAGERRGFVATASGLQRYRGRAGKVSTWERNWMTNHPVQGTAAVVFKVAGVRLDRLYRQYDAHLIVPLHDAFVFEAPLAHLQAVATLTERVMCDSVQEYFPRLRPRAEINIARPECWNKDGQADSVDKWIENPMFGFK